MAESIKDGSGKGYQAKVDDSQRVWTRAVAETPAHEAVLDENHYLVAGGALTLTDASKSSALYFQNNELRDLYIDRIILTSEVSAGGTHDHFLFSGTRNPTGMSGGTGNSAAMVNTNFGSTNLLESESEIGQQGATTTDGTQIFMAYFKSADTIFIEQRLLLKKGNSIAFEITPSVDNTSFDVSVGMNCHLVRP